MIDALAPARQSWLVRHAVEVAMVLLGGLALHLVFVHGLLSTQPPIDLFVYVRAGYHVLHGISPFSYPNSNHDYIYPMSFAMVVGVPLGLLGQDRAWVVWDCVSLLLLAATVTMGVQWAARVLRAEGHDDREWSTRRWLVAAWLVGFTWWAAHYSWGLGQAELLVASLLAGMFALPERWRPYGAGVLLGAGVLVKVSPIVMAPALFLVFGWRFVGGMATMLVPYLVLLAATGLWREDLYLFTRQLPVWKYNANFCDLSVYKLVCVLMFPSVFVREDGYYGGTMTTIIQVAVLATYAATGLWLWWRRAGWLAYVLIGIAFAHLSSPWLQPHHYAVVLVVVGPLAALGAVRGDRVVLGFVAALFALNIIMTESYDSGWFGEMQYLLLLVDLLLIGLALARPHLVEGARERVWLPLPGSLANKIG